MQRNGGFTSRIELLASLGLTAAALVMAAAVVHGEYARSNQTRYAVNLQAPAHYSNWQVLNRYGRRLDKSPSPINIVEFSDLECPACKQFTEQTLPVLRQRYTNQVSVTFIHFPLRMHRFAPISAKAAECAADQGRFSEFVGSTYAHQDSLGLASWSSLARLSGVSDSASFAKCLAALAPPALVDSGLAIGKRISVNGTPTVIVNGWRVTNPTVEEVERVIDDLRARKAPYTNVAPTLIQQ